MTPATWPKAALLLLLAPLCLAALACDEEPKEDLYPDPDLDRYDTGPVDPCQVEAAPGDAPDQAAAPLASAPAGVWLPAARAGAPWIYSANIPGSEADAPTQGQLPPGMSLSGGVVSGVPEDSATQGDQPGTYEFTVLDRQGAALRVSLSVYPAAGQPQAPPRYWEAGPYAIWNTQPTEACPMNPRLEQVGDTQDVDLYITYPTQGQPTQSGQAPVAPGRWPVVVFAHANNDTQCDINERYLSLHDHWASWGWMVVAVDGTSLNCMRGTTQNIELRSQGQLLALERLEELDQDPSSRFFGRVDLSRVVFAGHSRGGGASLYSALQFPSTRGVMDIQGVDLTAFGLGADALPPWPVLGLTAGEDVDLNYPIVEPTEDQLSGAYTWVNLSGGIHAHTADTVPIEPDDVPLISQQQQHDLTEFYTTAFLARWIGVGDGSAPMDFAPAPEADAALHSTAGASLVQEEISSRGVSVRWNRRVRGLLVDDFSTLGQGAPQSNRLSGAYQAQGMASVSVVRTYEEEVGSGRAAVYDKARALRLEPGDQGGSLRTWLSPDQSGLQVGPGASLQMRLKAVRGQPIPQVQVLVQTDQGEFTLEASDWLGSPALSDRYAQLYLPFAAAPELAQASEVISVALLVEGGVLLVDDVRIE